VDAPTLQSELPRDSDSAMFCKGRSSTQLLTRPARDVVCAIVVTFNPDSDLCSRLERIARQLPRVVIVDNCSTAPCVVQLTKSADQLGIHLILNSSNMGIARALNQGVRWAAEQGFGWVLALDQDTIIAPEMVESLGRVYRASTSPAAIAVIGSNFRRPGNATPFHNFTNLNGAFGREVKTVITSGSLMSLDVFHAIGGFRDDFFIDSVDLEYCLRARAHGFRVMMSSVPLMDHSIGRVSDHRLPWKNTGTSNHPPWRHYFMARNTMILAREYISKEPSWVLSSLWSRVKSILLVLFFERERLPKIRYFALGLIDGVLGRTNKLHPSLSESRR
jgi:rhamnosyltransferase